MRIRFAAGVVTIGMFASLTACSSDPDDTGGGEDAGADVVGTGAHVDSGADAGKRDTGTTQPDSGHDTGAVEVDGSTPDSAVDSGGTTGGDAGADSSVADASDGSTGP